MTGMCGRDGSVNLNSVLENHPGRTKFTAGVIIDAVEKVPMPTA